MNLAKTVFFIITFGATLTIVSAKPLVIEDEIERFVYEVSRDMGNHFIRTADRIDSLEATLSDVELQHYKYYFDYADAYVALVKEDYNKTIYVGEKALEHFMYSSETEWACRTLMLIGHTAAAVRLFPEAARVYKRVTDYSKDPYTLASSYLNLAKLRKSIVLDWKDDLAKGVYYSEMTGDPDVQLYARMVTYWLHPDSVDMATQMPLIAKRFHQIEHYNKEADAYKCLVFYYFNNGDYAEALNYADRSIEAYHLEKRPSKLLLGSIHFLKGNVLLQLKQREKAYEEYNAAIEINAQAGNKEGNYNLYKSMYRVEYKEEHYRDACFFLEKSNASYEYISKKRMEYYNKMSTLFRRIKVIDEKLASLKRQGVRRTVMIASLLILFFTTIIIWLFSLKRHFEKKSVDMEELNVKLKEETGQLLVRSSQNKLTSTILKNQSDLVRKMDKYLSKNKVLPDVISNRYAETMLCFDVELPMLSHTEKRYAVMIALDVPQKTVAELLNVKPETVAQYRNRLRKKLGISNTEIDLNVYLKNFLES